MDKTFRIRNVQGIPGEIGNCWASPMAGFESEAGFTGSDL